MTKMKRLFLVLITGLFIGGLGVGLTACPDNDGPAEEAGEKVDKAMEKAGDKMEDAGDKVEDEMDKK